MNVLLTGVHGFVGSNLVVSLGREHRLFGLDIVSPEKEGIVKTYSWDDLETGTIAFRRCNYPFGRKGARYKKTDQGTGVFRYQYGLDSKSFRLFFSF